DGGDRSKKADQLGADGPVSEKGFDYTHPGRLTVPAQLVMITDSELEILDRAAEEGRNGVDELQNYLVEQQININDLMRKAVADCEPCGDGPRIPLVVDAGDKYKPKD